MTTEASARRFRQERPELVLFLWSCLVAPVSLAGSRAPWETGLVRPSENKGRRGVYECTTDNPQYKYHVHVPKSYSEDNPAGLHIFFHGQGVPSGKPNFGRWAKYFLEPHNLIGINMQYMDGDNAKDTAGKVAAAERAIAQTVADYNVVVGRGVVGSFSGGGLPHGMLYIRRGKKKGPARGSWPFNHTAIYGSNFWKGAGGAAPMSWFIGVGSEEWNMGKPTLGRTQTARASELLSEARKGGCPDVYLKVTKGKGHTITDADVEASAEGFARSDLAFAPFLHAPDFPERRLKGIVAAANGLALGRAARSVEQLLSSPSADAALKAKAELISRRIDERVEAILGLTKELAQKDAVLCNYYGGVFARQLAGHPKLKDLRAILSSVAKKRDFRTALSAFPVFCQRLTSFFSGGAKLSPNAIPLLRQIETLAGKESLMGRMATEFLELQ